MVNPNRDAPFLNLLAQVMFASREGAGVCVLSLSEVDDNMLFCCLLSLSRTVSLMCIPDT
jgi:hypothetical protein